MFNITFDTPVTRGIEAKPQGSLEGVFKASIAEIASSDKGYFDIHFISPEITEVTQSLKLRVWTSSSVAQYAKKTENTLRRILSDIYIAANNTPPPSDLSFERFVNDCVNKDIVIGVFRSPKTGYAEVYSQAFLAPHELETTLKDSLADRMAEYVEFLGRNAAKANPLGAIQQSFAKGGLDLAGADATDDGLPF